MNENSHKISFHAWATILVVISFAIVGWFCAGWFFNDASSSFSWLRIVLIECFVVGGLFFWYSYSLVLSFAIGKQFSQIKKSDSWTYLIFWILLFYPRLSGVAELFPAGQFKIIFFITICFLFFLLKLFQLFYWLWGALMTVLFFFSLVLGIALTELKIAPSTVFDAFSLKAIVGSQFVVIALIALCFAVVRPRAKRLVVSLLIVSFSLGGWYHAIRSSPPHALPSRRDIEALPPASGKWLFSDSPKVRNVRIEVAGETRDAVYFLFPDTVSERVTLPPDAQLKFGVAVPYFSEETSIEGVKITLLADEKPLWSAFLDPVHNRQHRGWQDYTIDLSTFSVSNVELKLKVEGAPHLAISAPQVFSPSQKDNPPNIVFILIDTLRADKVGFGGYPQNITPNLDAMAESGVVFERAISTAPWTEPATAAIFTGMLPSQTGVGFPDVTLPSSAKTLAEYLLEIGYSTAGFSGNPLISARFNFDKGFTFFNEKCVDHFQWRSAECLTDEALFWLKKEHEQPFFLYVHYIDPHARYDAPPPYHDRFSYGYTGNNEAVKRGDIIPFEMRIKRGQKVELSAYDAEYLEKLYLGEIAYLDEQVARLVEFVKQNSRAPTLFIITSDHGEEFMEHNIVGHIYNLHDTLLHVPLIFFGAGMKSGVRIKNCVSTADITPTLLDMLGLEPPQNSWGISLKPLLEGGTIEERIIFSERADFWQNSYSVIANNWKLIFFPSKKSSMLFDIANDEGEYRNLFGKGLISEEVLLTELNEILNWIANHKLPPTAPDKERLNEHKKRLKALGYLGN